MASMIFKDLSSMWSCDPVRWLVVVLLIGPAAAIGQQVGDDSSELREIVVTATKAETSLSKTPVAVGVVSQEELEAAGVARLQDLTSATPNVQFNTQGYTNGVQMSIRGITSQEAGDAAVSASAPYVDGVYVPRPSALSGAFFDLDRLEVVRGPQGTLYGRNAVAGDLNIITADPKPVFGAYTEVSAGNYGDVESQGHLNLPIDPTLAVRIAYFVHRNDGIYDTEGTTAQNYQQADERAVRLTGLWQPNENFKWRLSLEDYTNNGTPTAPVVTGTNGSPVNGGSPYRGAIGPPDPQDYVNNAAIRSRVEWAFDDNLSLVYVAGVGQDKYKIVTQWPSDTTPLGYQKNSANNHNQYQEVNLIYNSSRLRNVFGGNYATESNTNYYNNPLPVLGNINLIVASGPSYSSWGVFDQATFKVTDPLSLIAGVRYSHDDETYLGSELLCAQDVFYFGGSVPSTCTTTAYNVGGDSGSWSKVNWKVGATYDVNDKTLTYLTVSTGYKAGGLNLTLGAPATLFAPENVTNYELGLKTHFLEDRAELNAALFYEDYSNLQVNQFVGLSFITQNAAKAASYGLELDGRWRMTHEDYLEAFLNYLHATYKQYNNAVDQDTGVNYASLAGHFLPNAPEESARLQYSHEFSLKDLGTLTPGAAVYWQSKSYLREFNLPIDAIGAYSKTSMTLTYRDRSERWSATAFVNNLENNAVRNGQLVFLGQYYSYYNPPRLYGLRISYGFK